MPEYKKFYGVNRSVAEMKAIFEARISDAVDVFEKHNHNFVVRDCPVCGSSHYTEKEKFYDTYCIAQCDSCLSLYVNPCPTDAVLDDYYNNFNCNKLINEMFLGRARKEGGEVSEKVVAVADLIQESLLKFETVAVLEIACNSGMFLSDLKSVLISRDIFQRVTLHGIDIDRSAVNASVDPDINLEGCSASEFLKVNNQKFEVVLHFELIEHLCNPSEFMKDIKALMVPGGVQHFHTPNGNGFENLALGYNVERPIAHGIYPPMHLQAFTVENIMHFALRHGFKLENVETPGELDVDIVNGATNHSDIAFSLIDNFSEPQLAIIQAWLVKMKSSSHMRVTLRN